MTLCRRLMRLIAVLVLSCAVSALSGTITSGNTAPDSKRILHIHSPVELRANPALLEDHPFGVVIGTVRDADTGQPVPNSIVTLVTRTLLQEKGEDGLNSVAGRTGDSYLRRTFTDGRGEFGFWYVPRACLSQEFVLIVRPFGYESVTIDGVRPARGRATVISAQANRRH